MTEKYLPKRMVKDKNNNVEYYHEVQRKNDRHIVVWYDKKVLHVAAMDSNLMKQEKMDWFEKVYAKNPAEGELFEEISAAIGTQTL